MNEEHRVLALWVRPKTSSPLEPRSVLELLEGEGVVGDHTLGRLRHVTIVFEDDWNTAVALVSSEPVDPLGRRANVLVSGGSGGRWIGKMVKLGEATVEIKAETVPCPVMELAATGLQDALRPDHRAGVWGRIKGSGEVRPGDTLEGV